MNDERLKQMKELRSFAERFRVEARATDQFEYIEMMTRSAADLDRMADDLQKQFAVDYVCTEEPLYLRRSRAG